LEILAVDLAYQPNAVTVARPGRYAVKLVNAGDLTHDITFSDGTKISASAGAIAVGEVEVPEDGISFICAMPGHSQSGMKGEIMVAANRTKKNTADDHGGPAATTVAADPKAPNYRLYDATAPKALPGRFHDIDLVVQEKMMTVAQGFVQEVWAFNGTVPGPVIRVKIGDTIRVHLKNPITNRLGHSVDFHASQVAWNDEMTTISPGEEKLYEWHADYAGVWMYHCGSTPALHHIANGLYGMVIVEPQNGLASVDHEFALVQSEWYLGPQRQPTDLAKAAAAAPAPDIVVFNGVANQYKDHPLEVGTGKKVRIFVLNTGPSVDSSFHIVGTIFNTVIKEGVNLTPKNPGHYGAQAVDLAPAQAAIIEFTTAEDGLYPIVTHAFNFVGRGALGLVKAGDGDPKGTGVAAK
jgi:nitrite reductase (NO-forming)